jgi:hypothetical protein
MNTCVPSDSPNGICHKWFGRCETSLDLDNARCCVTRTFRFSSREQETRPSQTGLRGRAESRREQAGLRGPVKTCVEGTMTTDYDPDGRLLWLDPIQIKSKHDFETQSEVAFRNETTSRIGRCDQPEVRVSYAPVGIAEVWMIGEIEGLNPELHL